MRRAALLATALSCLLTVPAVAAGTPEYVRFGIDTAGMDTGIRPGDDFVAYAGGKYLSALDIPADRSNFGMFTKLRDLSQERTRTIVEAAAAAAPSAANASETQKVGDFYASFMDEAAIEAKGIAPLQPRLAAIAAITDRAGLARELGGSNRIGLGSPFAFGFRQDLKNPDIFAVYLRQGGLGLPDRDYYLDDKNPKFAAIRAKYKTHVAAMLRLAGFADADARAAEIYDLEAKIAAVHWPRAQLRQVDQTYNPVEAAALPVQFPGVDWPAMRSAAGITAQSRLIVANPSAIAGTAMLVESAPLSAWKSYLAWRSIDAAAPYLPKAFVDADFAFGGTVLSGTPEIQPRWKRGVDFTSGALGEAAGKLYVAKYFPPEAKAKADALVKNIIVAMDARLAALPWMDPATRVQARAKLAAFKAKIGYPDSWRDYSALTVVRGDALGNAQRASAFQYARQLGKLGQPIDRSEWSMTPMTVNAYANPTWNEIVFPAAILQAPFFDPNADPAVNYGGIGLVIGHEISHHFDDQGRKYDKDGKLSDWWTAEDVKRFTALTDKVVAQYAAYEPLAGSKVNGELTLGENMADLAGLNVSYDAYRTSLVGKPAPILDGTTGDQRFFLGFAQVWRQKYRDASLLQQLVTDPHTPGHFRPYVSRNVDAWYTAFDVKPGEKLYLAPADRIKVW
ncbi:MAG: M13 family metallopeptidase [Polymorphobacter sp.]